jgi:hypothetical protein
MGWTPAPASSTGNSGARDLRGIRAGWALRSDNHFQAGFRLLGQLAVVCRGCTFATQPMLRIPAPAAPGKRRFPALAVAATMSMPNVRVAEEAVSLMRATKALGLEPRVGDADKQYWANSTTERLHDDAIKEGFHPPPTTASTASATKAATTAPSTSKAAPTAPPHPSRFKTRRRSS